MSRRRECEFCSATTDVELFAAHWMCQVCRHLSLPIEPIEPSSSLPLAARRFSGGGDGSLGGDADRTAARARALGADVSSGALTGRFPCVLPEHDHLAQLHPSRDGFWHYRCKELEGSLELAEVEAFLAYGERRKLSVVQRVRWRELLDYRAGLSDRGPARIPLPPRCSPSTREVGKAWRLHVGLRNPEAWPVDEAFIFAREYAMARAGVTDAAARRGVRELEQFGSMIRVGFDTRTRSILWRPGPTLLLRFGTEELVLEELKKAFNATEIES